MNKKYKFDLNDTIEVEFDYKLYRIIALVDIGDNIKAGNSWRTLKSEES